jgi:cell division protein FtsZ
MSISLKLPENIILKPTITVFGVGGAGGNAVNNMIRANLQGAKFVVANTDAQALEHALSENRIQLGLTTTKGLGAGASPEVGEAAAKESEEEIKEMLQGSNMVFITGGMGGGTGTGAAPHIAKVARDLGILTVGVVTKPFHFEGQFRMRLAERGLEEMQKNVDTLIVIPNQNLFHIANEKTTFADAFKMADDVLHSGVRGITDLMIMPGLINLDFADIRAVMSEMGKAMMGTGEASGSEDRAIRAAEAAISNPLLDHRSVKGAKGVLINITGGMDMTLFEVDAAANKIREEVGDDSEANIIFGSTFNKDLDGIIRVSVVATGIDADHFKENQKSYHMPTVTTPIEEVIVEYQEEETKFSENEEQNSEEENNTGSDYEERVLVYAEAEQKEEQVQTEMSISDDEPRIIAPIVPEIVERKDNSPKVSIFGRMLNSFRSQVPNSLKQGDNKLMPRGDRVEPINETPDIYDVPAFLRRK